MLVGEACVYPVRDARGPSDTELSPSEISVICRGMGMLATAHVFEHYTGRCRREI